MSIYKRNKVQLAAILEQMRENGTELLIVIAEDKQGNYECYMGHGVTIEETIAAAKYIINEMTNRPNPNNN